ncbi:unnamed protein product [Aureobasidium pullulans]|nr:unnamed protein product [Aureobasidium pullulans]
MYTKAFIPAILLAGQAVNAVALPATTVTLHSVITRTTVVPATTEAAGSNPSNAATPARFSPSADDTTVVALSSFSDASPSRMTQLTVTVTERHFGCTFYDQLSRPLEHCHSIFECSGIFQANQVFHCTCKHNY